MEQLQTLLDNIGSGKIPEDQRFEVIGRLKGLWDDIDKPDVKLYAFKLDRAESLEWDSPNLRFDIERHGGTALGSSRAELQTWWVDLKKGEADYFESGYRQIKPRQRPWYADEPAREVAQLIINKQRDARLKWLSDQKVQVLTREIIPKGPKQTVDGRRQRFYKALDKRLESEGWTRSRSYFEKEAD